MNFSVLVISDKITESTDKSGKLLVKLLKKEHKFISKQFCKNDEIGIRVALDHLLSDEADFVFCIGGTGISKKDVTINVVKPLIKKEIPGFSELFRYLSYQEIGTKAIMSRALLGITENCKVICCLPGSSNAVELAVNKILSTEIAHIVSELSK